MPRPAQPLSVANFPSSGQGTTAVTAGRDVAFADNSAAAGDNVAVTSVQDGGRRGLPTAVKNRFYPDRPTM